MFAPRRVAHSRRRTDVSPAAIAEVDQNQAGAGTHLLEPRPEDLGATWPAHAHRCRQALPADLSWAAPLIDPDHPRAVCCGREQACRLIVWHHHLPTYEHVSFSCQRLTCSTDPASSAGLAALAGR